MATIHPARERTRKCVLSIQAVPRFEIRGMGYLSIDAVSSSGKGVISIAGLDDARVGKIRVDNLPGLAQGSTKEKR